MRRLLLASLISLSLAGCAGIPGLGTALGGSAATDLDRAAAEQAALSMTTGGIGGAIGGDTAPTYPPAQMVVALTIMAPYNEFVTRGLAENRQDVTTQPTYLVVSQPKDPETGGYWQVRTLVVNGRVLSQASAPRFWQLDPFATGSDTVEGAVGNPFPRFGSTTTFTLKNLTLATPIKFFLGVARAYETSPRKWIALGEFNATGGTINVPVLVKEDMGTYTDGSPARFEKGYYYGLGYMFEGMSYPTAIKACPLGLYIPKD